jgi:hypothetical protein
MPLHSLDTAAANHGSEAKPCRGQEGAILLPLRLVKYLLLFRNSLSLFLVFKHRNPKPRALLLVFISLEAEAETLL